MKFCTWCGQQIADDDIFCANCGKRADGSDMPAQQPQSPAAPAVQPQQQWQQPQQVPPQWQQPPQQQWPPQGQWQQPVTPPPQKGGKGALIGGIVAGVVVVAVLVGGFVWPGFFKKDKTEPDVSAPPKTEATEKPAATPKPKATDAPKATETPKETEAPKPIATSEPTPAPTPEPTAAPYVNTFTDVKESDWYYDAVFWAGKNGIVSGTEFKPGDPANRGQALTFLWRAAGQPETILKVSPYTDVREGDWYYTPVLWGFENGLISTSSDGQFHADGTLTRAQAITFLCRALEGKPAGNKRSFADVREGDWYFDTANWALENGVVGRDESRAFLPDDTVTRAQFVTFLHRAYDPAAKKAADSAPQRGFADYGITAVSATSNRVQTINVVTPAGEMRQFEAYVATYEIFEEGYDLPRREGWEYRDLDLCLDYGSSGSVNTWASVLDYYSLKPSEYKQYSEDADGNLISLPIIRNGEIVDCSVWIKYTDEPGSTIKHAYLTAQVPKGYDGIVYFLHGDQFRGSRTIETFYTGPEDFITIRLDGQAD